MPSECKEYTIESASYQHLKAVWTILHNKSVKAKYPRLPLEMVSKGLVRYFYSLKDSSSNPTLSPHIRVLIIQLNLLIKKNIFNKNINAFLINFVNDMSRGGKKIKAYIAHDLGNDSTITTSDIDSFLARLNLIVEWIEVSQQYCNRSIHRAIKATNETENTDRWYEIYAQEFKVANKYGILSPADLACFQFNLGIFCKDIPKRIHHLQELLHTTGHVKERTDYLLDLEERAKKELLHALEGHAHMQFTRSVAALNCKDKPRHIQHLREVLRTISHAKVRNDYLLNLEKEAKMYLLKALKDAASTLSDNDERKTKLYLLALHLARENNRAPLEIPRLLRNIAIVEWNNNRKEKYSTLMQLAIQFCDDNQDKFCDLLPIRDEIASDVVVGLIIIATNMLSKNKLDQSNCFYKKALALLETIRQFDPSMLSALITELFILTKNTVDPAEKQARYEQTLVIARKLDAGVDDVVKGEQMLGMQTITFHSRLFREAQSQTDQQCANPPQENSTNAPF